MCLYFVGADALIGPLGGSFHRKSFAAPAATYFARGGSSSQSPLVSVSARRRKLRPLPCSISALRAAALRRLRSETHACGQVSSPHPTRCRWARAGNPFIGAPRSIPWPRSQGEAGPQWGPAKKVCGKSSVPGQSSGDDGHGIGPTKCSILRGPVGIELLRAAKPPFRQGFVLGTKRLYAPFGAPHRRRNGPGHLLLALRANSP